MPAWFNDELFRWVTNNGLATVFVVLMLGLVVTPLFVLLRFVLDGLARDQAAAFRTLAASVEHLDKTLDKLASQASANHEALSNVLLFVSRTQTDVVLTQRAVAAHREIVEPAPVLLITQIEIPEIPDAGR